MATTTTLKRQTKWHHPFAPPPPPKILHLPHLPRKKPPPPTTASSSPPPALPCGRLEALFQQERRFSAPATSPEDDPCRLQVEILRAECNYLRMERDVAVKRLERHRSHAEHALRSAVHAVASGTGGEGEVLLRELQRKLERLQGSRRTRSCRTRVGFNGNFDRKALVLRRRLQEMNVRQMMPKGRERRGGEELEDEDDDGGSREEAEEEEEEEVSVREIREIAADTTDSMVTALPEVEILRRKMDCISKGMLERVEEYGTILLPSSPSSSINASSTINSSSSCCCCSCRRGTANYTTAPNWKRQQQRSSSSSSHRPLPRFNLEYRTGKAFLLEEMIERIKVCGGRCREVVEKVVAQVKAETEQWGEMQGMLELVREEMDDLRCARDFWERCALQSDQRLRSLNSKIKEWRQRAHKAESRAAELRKQLVLLRDELADAKREAAIFRPPPTTSVVVKSRSDTGDPRTTDDLLKEKEDKHVLFRRFLDENFTRPKPVSSGRRRRVALRDIGNHL